MKDNEVGQFFDTLTEDYTAAREDIIECSIDRAKEHYGRNTFESVVYVGDAEWDLIAARKLEIGFVGVAEKGFSDNGIAVVADFAKPVEFIRLLDSVASSYNIVSPEES